VAEPVVRLTVWRQRLLRWLRKPTVLGWLLLLALLAAYTVYHRVQWSPLLAPPGSDGGNWLALSREIFGETVKAARVTYPPMVPALVAAADLILPPLAAVKLVAWACAASVSIPVYLLLRGTVNPWLAAGLAFSVCAMDYTNDILAWGGYPQLLGVSLLLFAVYFGQRGLSTGRRRYLVVSAVTTALMAATHTLAVLEYAFVFVLLVALNYYSQRHMAKLPPGRAPWRLIAFWVAVTALCVLPLLPLYLRTWERLAVSPFNLQQLDLASFLAGFRNWPPEFFLWRVLGVIGGAACGWLVIRRGEPALAGTALALGLGAAIVFGITGEIRASHLFQIAIVLSVGVTLAWGYRRLPQFRPSRQELWRILLAGYLVVILVSVLYFGESRATRAFAWFRVVDTPVKESIDWLRENAAPGELVVASETPRDQIPGWWVEGYAGLPTYLAVDTRWLIFRDEKQQAAVAHALISDSRSVAELRELVAEHDIRYVLLHKQVETAATDPLRNLIAAGFEVALENERVVLLQYRGQP